MIARFKAWFCPDAEALAATANAMASFSGAPFLVPDLRVSDESLEESSTEMVRTTVTG